MIHRIPEISALYLAIVTGICIFSLQACEEYFSPELEDFDSVLVIDGGITNLPGPYDIELKRSEGVSPSDQKPIEGALVTIIEEGGISETLAEIQPGKYVTAENGIQGIPGNSYKLSITLKDGTQYETAFQKMPATIGIDSISANFEYQYVSVEEPEVPGFQFNVTSSKAESSENYLMWSMEATYKYQSDFTINYLYANYQATPYPNPTEFMTCWRTWQINKILTFNTESLSTPRIRELPLHFQRADGREISIRYSLLVNQFTITREAYDFWSKLERLIDSQETLYSTQPFQIRGNLYNINDEDEPVLGFFLVAGRTQKRIYVNHPDAYVKAFSYCEPDFMSYAFVGLMHRSTWPIFVYEDDEGRRSLASDGCFDCRVLGGTIIKPDFWEE